MKKILFIASHRPQRAPGQRFRFEMFFDDLAKNGIEAELSYLLNEEDDRVIYSKANYLAKIRIGLKSILKRRADLKRVHEFDLVVIFREALMTKSIFFEKAVHRKGIPMLFDFDDAIWIKDVSANNRVLSYFKDENKIRKILPLCQAVTAGNAYLADFAKTYNKEVHIIPSTIDEQFHREIHQQDDKKVCVGWSGSHTTLAHFETLLPVLEQLRTRYGESIRLLTIGAKSTFAERLNIEYLPWKAESENEDLNQIDIGLMPLPNSLWTSGKCGMKALLYMSASKPAIVTPLGVNAEIVEHGINGYHAQSSAEWLKYITELIDDPEKRIGMGKRARQKVVNDYSKKTWSPILLAVYKKAMNSR